MAMEKEGWIKIAFTAIIVSVILLFCLAIALGFFERHTSTTTGAKTGLTPKAQEFLARGAVESTADKAAPILNQSAATPVAKAPEKPAETKVIAKTPEPEATAAKAAIPVVVPETEKTPGVSKEEFQQEVNKLKAAISYQAGKLDACCDYSKPAANQEKISHPNKAIGKHPVSGQSSQSKGRKAKRQKSNGRQDQAEYVPPVDLRQGSNDQGCQVPLGTDYPDRFMHGGPGCNGKTCSQNR